MGRRDTHLQKPAVLRHRPGAVLNPPTEWINPQNAVGPGPVWLLSLNNLDDRLVAQNLRGQPGAILRGRPWWGKYLIDNPPLNGWRRMPPEPAEWYAVGCRQVQNVPRAKKTGRNLQGPAPHGQRHQGIRRRSCPADLNSASERQSGNWRVSASDHASRVRTRACWTSPR
jgi:hypothetical protein